MTPKTDPLDAKTRANIRARMVRGFAIEQANKYRKPVSHKTFWLSTTSGRALSYGTRTK